MNRIEHIGFGIAIFKDQEIVLDLITGEDWPHKHEVEIVHHYDEKGNHFCPTQFVMCIHCGAIGDEPEPFECNKHGEK